MQEAVHGARVEDALEFVRSRYAVRLAHSADDLDRILRLRFDVFNLELGEGLDSSFLTSRDRDEFDSVCDHLMVVENATDEVIGTYRMQTYEMSRAGRGFYSADEFDLSLPQDVLTDSIEIGRACIARPHRNGRVLFLLWRSLARYLLACRKRYLFGCCSLTSQDPHEGKQVMSLLEAEGHIHPALRVLPQPEYQCYSSGLTVRDGLEVKLPRLFRMYLDYGAKVCGPPAIDRRFNTIDYFVLLDAANVDPRTYEMFFQ